MSNMVERNYNCNFRPITTPFTLSNPNPSFSVVCVSCSQFYRVSRPEETKSCIMHLIIDFETHCSSPVIINPH